MKNKQHINILLGLLLIFCLFSLFIIFYISFVGKQYSQTLKATKQIDRGVFLGLNMKKTLEGYTVIQKPRTHGVAWSELLEQQIIQALDDAWEERNIYVASQTNSENMKNYYSDHLLENLHNVVNYQLANKYQQFIYPVQHKLKFHDLASDGSIINFTDIMDVEISMTIHNNSDEPTVEMYRVERDIVMWQQGTFWKIAFLKETLREKITPTSTYEHKKSSNRLGVNYYPKSTPWDQFWPQYNQLEVESDILKSSEIGFKSLRIFVSIFDIGFRAAEEDFLAKLKNFLYLSRKYNMSVILTLFDRMDYKPQLFGNFAQQIVRLKDIFNEYQDIITVDIKNEPDLDYKLTNKKVVNGFLRSMVNLMKINYPNIPVTIGWSHPNHWHNVHKNLDVISFHYYDHIDNFKKSIDLIETNKPKMLTEYGLPTFNSWLLPHGHSYREQNWYSAKLTTECERYLDACLLWTLYDFVDVPSWVAPFFKSPVNYYNQRNMGVLTTDLKEKPIARWLKSHRTITPDKPTKEMFFKPFKMTLFILLLFSLYIIRYIYIRFKNSN